MADIAKISGMEIANIAKMLGIAGAKVMGIVWPTGGGDVFPDDWTWKKSITLSRASGAVTNYQMKMIIHRSTGTDSGADVYVGTKCNADYSDIRITISDGTTLLDYWIEISDSSSATIYIEFDSIGTTDTTFYLFYGCADASAYSNGANTFLFYEDFNSLTDGDLNGQNGWSGSDAFDVETGTKYEGEKAVQVTNVSIGQIDHALTVTSYNLWVEMQMMSTNVSAYDALEYYLMEGTSVITGGQLSNGGVRHLIASVWESVVAGSNNTWYKVKIALDSANTHKIWVNDTPYTPAHLTNLTNVSSTVNKLRLEQYTASGDVCYLDTIKVGQYLATEPAWGTWGSEEAA